MNIQMPGDTMCGTLAEQRARRRRHHAARVKEMKARHTEEMLALKLKQAQELRALEEERPR